MKDTSQITLPDVQGVPNSFRQGIDGKLVKEVTGHTSNAVDKYQMTSHEQRHRMSEILSAKPSTNTFTASDGNGNVSSEALVNSSGKGVTKIRIDIQISHE